MTVVATSLSSATFSLTNHATGQKDTATLADQAPLLCGFNAEWIVEDFWGTDGVPLVDFGSLTFTAAVFKTDTGISGGVEGAKMDGVKEKAGGKAAIECEKLGGSGLTCAYNKQGASP
jgi:hypothetical protein